MISAGATRGALTVLVLGTLLCVCACVTPPKALRQRPALSGASLGLAGATSQPAPQEWWRSFGDPQLNRLMEVSLRDNPGLAQALARVHEAQAQAQQQHAGMLPSAKLNGGETRLKIPAGFPEAIGGGSSVWAGDLGALLSWDLDLWGKQADALTQARVLAQAADLDLDNARLLLAGALSQAYVDLHRSYALADIAERAEAQRVNILAITRQRVAAGLDTRVELREAEAAVPQARVELAQARSAQALAVHELAALSGRGADAYPALARPQINLERALPLPEQLPVNLLGRRPDVIAARLRIDAADAGKRAAKAAFYPNLSLTALAGYASFSLSDLISAKSFGYGAGPALSLPLFDGGRLRSQYRGAEAAFEQAVASYDDTVVHAVREAADQLTLIDALSGELEQQRMSLDAAEDAYRLAEERYRAGLTSYLSVLNAETEVLDARRQHVELSASLVLARITLLLAVGGSFQLPAPSQAGNPDI